MIVIQASWWHTHGNDARIFPFVSWFLDWGDIEALKQLLFSMSCKTRIAIKIKSGFLK